MHEPAAQTVHIPYTSCAYTISARNAGAAAVSVREMGRAVPGVRPGLRGGFGGFDPGNVLVGHGAEAVGLGLFEHLPRGGDMGHGGAGIGSVMCLVEEGHFDICRMELLRGPLERHPVAGPFPERVAIGGDGLAVAGVGDLFENWGFSDLLRARLDPPHQQE